MKKIMTAVVVTVPLFVLSGCGVGVNTLGYSNDYVTDTAYVGYDVAPDNVYTVGYDTGPYWGNTYYTGFGPSWGWGLGGVGFAGGGFGHRGHFHGGHFHGGHFGGGHGFHHR
jgi:hypothetical protein